MAARAIGSGTVSFGLVSIPIKIYTTNKTGVSIRFNMVHASCGTRVKQQYVCPTDDVVVERSEMAKGYEFQKGQYVILSEEEIKALEAVSNNSIELTEFVPADAVDPVYFEKTYYLGPDKGGDRAYRLLSESMVETGLVGLAKYSARGKQYIVMVRPHAGGVGLVMQQLRYSSEVRDFSEVPMDEAPEIADAELKLAIQIIEQIAADEFNPDQYKDEVRERVLDLIQRKVDGEEITAAPEAPQGQIIDLMEALKASLGDKDAGKKAPAAKKKATSSKKKATTAKKKAPAKKKSTKRAKAK